MNKKPLLAMLTVVAGLGAFGLSEAQAPAVKRTLLQRVDLGDGREAILGMAEIAPGGATGRHMHFGIETGYIAEGSTTLEVEGEPTKMLKPGDSYQIAAGKVHNAKNEGSGAAKVIANYVVDKDKPLATVAP